MFVFDLGDGLRGKRNRAFARLVLEDVITYCYEFDFISVYRNGPPPHAVTRGKFEPWGSHSNSLRSRAVHPRPYRAFQMKACTDTLNGTIPNLNGYGGGMSNPIGPPFSQYTL